MKDANAETLVEVRDLLSRLHDAHLAHPFHGGLSLMEMAGLRDSIRRINEVLTSEAKEKKT